MSESFLVALEIFSELFLTTWTIPNLPLNSSAIRIWFLTFLFSLTLSQIVQEI
jgi:hypothetical protein